MDKETTKEEAVKDDKVNLEEKTVTATKVKTKKVEDIKFKGRYTYAVGRRKTSVAQVRVFKGSGGFVVNKMTFVDYFTENVSNIALQSLEMAGLASDMDISVVVSGGGKKAQADAIRHGVSRALLILNEDLKPALRAKG